MFRVSELMHYDTIMPLIDCRSTSLRDKEVEMTLKNMDTSAYSSSRERCCFMVKKLHQTLVGVLMHFHCT